MLNSTQPITRVFCRYLSSYNQGVFPVFSMLFQTTGKKCRWSWYVTPFSPHICGGLPPVSFVWGTMRRTLLYFISFLCVFSDVYVFVFFGCAFIIITRLLRTHSLSLAHAVKVTKVEWSASEWGIKWSGTTAVLTRTPSATANMEIWYQNTHHAVFLDQNSEQGPALPAMKNGRGMNCSAFPYILCVFV